MSFQTLNPATGKVVKEFPLQSDQDIARLLEVADDRFRSDWRLRPVAERARVVARAAQILRARREEYADLITLEMGRVRAFSLSEVDLAANILDYYARKAEEFLQPKAIPEAPGCSLVMEPIGVILGIEPWNFPYYQLARVAGPQLVAGNVVMIKHAENVPQCALAFARLFEEAGAPPGVYTNLFCSVEQVGALIDDFRVRGVTLTGSERAGAAVAQRAGANLKKVVLELGGSDPAIVLEDADLAFAVDQCVIGRIVNAGQTCVATKRLIVVGRERGEQVLSRLIDKFSMLTVGDPMDPKSAIGPIVSERALHGLLDQIEGAKNAGARVVFGGRQIDRPGFYLEPTIITDIAPENPLYQQEAFGPVLSFYVVDTEEEAVALANATKYGLGSSVFGSDIEHAKKVAEKIEAGMVCINSYFHTSPEAPFGGVKNSGFGRELSELGIKEFVNQKLVRIAA
ncbi:NAD-dependent succinate-semialdehyde dehydrogenase [Achromobacter sp. Marseille-Q0513]|uniref:NAD-dependent succinate-semialdehyde dehydrogenase n=1 Tax=Achromobacter sp. Marseille-Q0513 TaxID=2829161 RepID=UPI001B9AE908|nr:NAD-dependent succinate-semialdehyde dehydrogenase [Achromobacter sp. Marseille-Q0513]MBR8655183.1 NAD-dependent succinate-semialdehyde dehydrogenase [Achromobacter sp. Marseille-Q0513]